MKSQRFLELLTLELTPLDSEQSYRSLFRVISNHKQYIRIDDLYRFVSDLELGVTDEQVHKFFFSFKLTDRSKIEFDVFYSFLQYSKKMAEKKKASPN